MIHCVIIDDEQHAIDVLRTHISRLPALVLVYATTDPVKGFQYVQENQVDLIFLDIQMPELTGLQFLELLKEKTKVILTTAYSEHALQGYEHNITDYLLKPVQFDRFLKAVQKVLRQVTEKEFLFVKTGTRNKLVKVEISSIEYVESKGNYISFITPTENVMTLLTLKELEQELPKNTFIRIHQSYIVPINKIVAIAGNELQVGQHHLPIGETYKKNLLEHIGSHIVHKKN